jgi:hypothetical protein
LVRRERSVSEWSQECDWAGNIRSTDLFNWQAVLGATFHSIDIRVAQVLNRNRHLIGFAGSGFCAGCGMKQGKIFKVVALKLYRAFDDCLTGAVS